MHTNRKSASESPIYIAGLPRSGTTWVASVLNTGRGIKYLHEPFNIDRVKKATPHWLKYLRSEDSDPDFYGFCSDAFSCRLKARSVNAQLKFPYRGMRRMLRFLPGRVMIKDVFSYLSLDWIDTHFSPKIVVVVRHPVANALSWSRLFKRFQAGRIRALERIKEQSTIFEDYLKPFEDLYQETGDSWYNFALLWGSAFYVLDKQIESHQEWIFVRHEDLCLDPPGEFRKLFEKLEIEWNSDTEKFLSQSTASDSGKAYIPGRVTSQEIDKWREQVSPQQVQTVKTVIDRFGIDYYANSY